MKCNNCGTENLDGARFCVKCGTTFDNAVAPVAPQPESMSAATPQYSAPMSQPQMASTYSAPAQPQTTPAYSAPAQPQTTPAYSAPAQPQTTPAYGASAQPQTTPAYSAPAQPQTTPVYSAPAQTPSYGAASYATQPQQDANTYSAASPYDTTSAYGAPSAPYGTADATSQYGASATPAYGNGYDTTPGYGGMPYGAPAPARICGNCKSTIPDGAFQCQVCGAPATLAVSPQKKKSPVGMIVGIIGGVLAVVIAVVVGLSVYRSSQYEKGMTALENASYSEAYEIFDKLGSYEEAEKLAAYSNAQALLESGKYADAQAAFEKLGSFRDSADMAAYCANFALYDEANGYFNNGEFYKAWLIFSDLSGFEDSYDRAEACVQTPPTKIIEQNPSYVSENAGTGAVNNSTKTYYFEYYDGDVLALSFVVAPLSTTKLLGIKPGLYTIKVYTGPFWFGDADKFGDMSTPVHTESIEIPEYDVYAWEIS